MKCPTCLFNINSTYEAFSWMAKMVDSILNAVLWAETQQLKISMDQ